MQTKLFMSKGILPAVLFFAVAGCQKENVSQKEMQSVTEKEFFSAKVSKEGQGSNEKDNDKIKPKYNLEAVLYGEGNQNGHIHFRQDPDPAKIITLDTKVHHLLPNHEYLLQRAVDAINVVDGDCTSTSWLTLGHGLTPQSILTDDKGNGEEVLWRDVSAVPSGLMFDIHFRVIDKVSLEVVLTSDCYQYIVR